MYAQGRRVEDIAEKFIKQSTPGEGNQGIQDRIILKTHKNKIEATDSLFNNFSGNIIALTEDSSRKLSDLNGMISCES